MAFIPDDTRFGLQWHLLNDDPDEFDLNVVDVWDDYDGSGVRVAVLDQGFDYFHPDFDNYRTDLDWDFEDGDGVALPDFDPDTTDDIRVDAHGTPVMGIIGAAQDGVGTVGVAFGAELIGYKTNWSRDQVEAAIELATSDNHDIISMSYGEGANVFVHRNTLVDAAETAGETGRDGLGLIMVKSAGNSRKDPGFSLREETTGEALENLRHTIVVAGVSDEGELPPVDSQVENESEDKSSSPGANLLTTAFYGREGDSVQTTDRTGPSGYANGDYTGFTGTSAAAPQVSGVIALMLEANDNLGWRDVQQILAYSSRHIGSDIGAAPVGEEQGTQFNGSTWFWNDAENWNGGGLHFSNDYGFGLIDAKAAVRLAETWTTQRTSANEASTFQDGLNGATVIADGSTSGGSEFFSIFEAQNIEIENVTLGINFLSVEDLADLEIYLTSPSGTRIQLLNDTGDNEDWDGYWRFGATGFRGESSAGLWRVEIGDDDNAVTSPVEINDIDIWTYGSNQSNNDLFVFTNEFSDYAGVAGHSTNIVGGNGVDTINAAAVETGTIINLQAGTGAIDGVLITHSGIEDVYTGDFSDILFDGAGANDLYSGRGNDILRDTDAGGNDRYYGGRGNDTVLVNSAIGGDAFYGGSGADTISWASSGESTGIFDLQNNEARDSNGNVEVMSSFANLTGTEQGDTIIERNGVANVIDGGGGADTVVANSIIAGDRFRGGDGVDTMDWSGVDEDGATFDLAQGLAIGAGGASEEMSEFENIIGTENDDTIIENNFTNVIHARGGDDLVIVTSAIFNDSFTGGFGNDTIDWSGSNQNNGVYDISGGTASAGGQTETMFGFENFIGTSQRDTIIEGNGVNVINARGGNDIVEVNTTIGSDSFTGGFGTDTIDWSGSSQVGGVYDISGGTATAGRLSEVMFGFENFIGTNQADAIIEGAGANEINAGGGDDLVEVTTTIGVDSFTGGFGTDTIDWSGSSQVGGVYDISGGTATAGASTEIMFGFENFIGTNQADKIIEGPGVNVINAGGGDDIVCVTTEIGADSFAGGFGNDTIDWSGSTQAFGTYDLSAGTATAGGETEMMFGFENFIGTNQGDRLLEGSGSNIIEMGGGNDVVYVSTRIGADSFDGGAGLIDEIRWTDVNETGATFDMGAGTATDTDGNVEAMTNFESLFGTQNDDIILGNGAANLLHGDQGDDEIRGQDGSDTIQGAEGDDRLFGGDGNDVITGGEGDDLVVGGKGRDFLDGGAGDDRIRGDQKEDTLIDGEGKDRMTGKGGADRFQVGTDDHLDTIKDFQDGIDLIQLSGVEFADLDIIDQGGGRLKVKYDGDKLIVTDNGAGLLTGADLTEDDFIFA